MLDKEGFFSIMTSKLGLNHVLFEETEKGALEELVGEDDSRWKVWFSEVRRWDMNEGDLDVPVVFIPPKVSIVSASRESKAGDSLQSVIRSFPKKIIPLVSFDSEIRKSQSGSSLKYRNSPGIGFGSAFVGDNSEVVKCSLVSQKLLRAKKVKFRNLLDVGGEINKKVPFRKMMKVKKMV
ncbi:hypothetical protein RYX36_012149 [Vicia faba]